MSERSPRRRGRHASPEDVPDAVPASWLLDSLRREEPRDTAPDGTSRFPGLGAPRPGPPPPPGARRPGVAPAPSRPLPRTVAADLAALQSRDHGDPGRPDEDGHDGGHVDGGHVDGGHVDTGHEDDGQADSGHEDDGRADDGSADDGSADDGSADDEHDDFDYDAVPFYDEVEGGRRPRRPVAVLLSLVVLAGLVLGVAVGGKAIYRAVSPAAQDYEGAGTGTVQVRVRNGDTLSDIGRTLVSSGVVASSRPFLDAADGEPSATGIQPGVYGLREHMSGASALQLLLDPSSRLFSRVTLPEGLTVQQVLQKLADGTETPPAELQAAAAGTGALGLPPGVTDLEGYLFPATYDFEPKTPPADMLRAMVIRTEEAMDALGVTPEQRNSVLTEASIVQAEASSTEDMAKVARVLDNRLAAGMPLQLDTTVNYANGKAGITTTAEDRANPSPYNTYLHPGLPPGPISNPGEEAIRATLAPAQGDWMFFVVVNPDTGETRFARTAEEHQRNVLLFQQWLRAHPGG